MLNLNYIDEIHKRCGEEYKALRDAKKDLLQAKKQAICDIFGAYILVSERAITVNGCKVSKISIDKWCNLVCTWNSLPPIKDIPIFLSIVLKRYEKFQHTNNGREIHAYQNRQGTHLLICLFRQLYPLMDKEYVHELIKMGDLVPKEPSNNRPTRLRDWLVGTSYTKDGYLYEFFPVWSYSEFQDGSERYQPAKHPLKKFDKSPRK